MSLATREPHYDAGPRLLLDVWSIASVATVIVILRIIAKLRIGKFGADDLLMLFALWLAIVGSVMTTRATQLGYGRDVSSIDSTNVPKVIFLDYLAQAFGLAGGALGRISFIVFIIGLLVQSLSQRVILWVLVGLQVVVNSVFIIILFVQCPDHESALWAHSGRGKCWNVHVQAYYGYFQGAFNSATDLGLAVFSTSVFWNLKLKIHVKLGLIALLGLGIFAMVAAIIKTVQTRALGALDTDPTTATIPYERWLFIETYLVIITASIPCIRSLLRPMSERRKISTYTHELSSRYVGGCTRASRTRRRESSIDGKGIMTVPEAHLSSDKTFAGRVSCQSRESGRSRESVAICV